MINLDLEIGDTILTGKWRNKKVVVKTIGTDEHGSPTVNGKSILNIRIPKLYVKENRMKLKDLIKEDITKFSQLPDDEDFRGWKNYKNKFVIMHYTKTTKPQYRAALKSKLSKKYQDAYEKSKWFDTNFKSLIQKLNKV